MASPVRNTSVRFNLQTVDDADGRGRQGPHPSPPVVMHAPPRQHRLDLLFDLLTDSDDDQLRVPDASGAYLPSDFIELFDAHGSDRAETPRAWIACLPPLARALHELTLANLPADAMRRAAADKIAQGMDVAAVDPRYGRSVLHWAGMLAHPDLVVWLLGQGAAVHLDLPDHQGYSVMACVHAFRSLAGAPQVIDTLLSAGATLDAFPFKGAELLYRKDLSVAVIRKLLRAGVDADGGGAFESSPLLAGCGSVHWGAASLLLDYDADVHRRGAFGLSVLHNPLLPVWLAEQLHRRGADVNATDMLGETPLMLACAQGNLPLLRWLVSKGARLDAVADDGRSIADCAALGGPQVTHWLVRHGHLAGDGFAHGAPNS